MQLLCHLSCQGWTTAKLFVGHAKEPATETTASPEHCFENCHSNKEVKSHYSHFRELHLLPVEMRIDYKILSLVYRCMKGHSPLPLLPPPPPKYPRELIPRYLSKRRLRSSTQSRLRIPSVDQRNSNKHVGVRAFSNAEPKLWNSLPITLREQHSKETYVPVL